MIIDGKQIAQNILENLKKQPKPDKFLAVILVGEDPSSVSFIKQKEKTAKELGVDFRLYEFPVEIKNDELRKEVGKIANHKTCGGVIVQLPLPEQLNKHYILNVIPQEKDIDVLGERALGAFYNGRNPVLPPSVGVLEKIVKTIDFKLAEANAAIVGLGTLIGKPIAIWLVKKTKNLFLLGRNSDLKVLKNADLVICGVGKAGLIKPAMLKDGALIVDFGYSKDENGKTCGDFDYSEIENLKLKIENLRYTPTPGGTGPILVAKIFENFYRLNEKK